MFSALRSNGLLHEIRYEDLLAEPHETLAAIMSFLEQDVSKAALNELTASIRRSNAGKWERKMSPANLELFERVACETLRRFGYPATHEARPVGALAALRYAARDQKKHLANLIEMNVVDTIRIKLFGKEPFAE